MKYNHTGHRIGCCHHNTKHDDAIVEKARAMRDIGITYAKIGAMLGVSPWTIRDWCSYVTRWDILNN